MMVMETPWMESEPVEAGVGVRVSWIRHSDAFRAGGRAGAHRGPCRQDGAHMLLWHWCTGAVDMKAYGVAETAEFYPRWLVSAGPVLDGRKCCGMRGRVQDGEWVAA